MFTRKISKEKKIIFYTLLGILALFFLWWGISAAINSTLFPSPIKVLPTFFSYLGKSSTYVSIGWTFLTVFISFLISLIVGMIFGVLGGRYYRFAAVMQPFITLMRSLPTAAIVLVLIVLVKPVFTPIIVSSLVMFPLFYQAFKSGVESIHSNIKDEIKLDNVTIFNSLFSVYIPIISNYLLLAIIQSFGLGLKVSIMAEIVTGSNSLDGLGRMIHSEYLDANATNVIAISLVAILIIIIIDILFYFIKRKFNHGKAKN